MRVAVLGAGLQGACVALELAGAGIAVDLYDKNERALTQASSQNEGKIHLGYVYAGDRTLRTARTMIRGGIAFAALLRRWLGDALDTIPVAAPFNYVVHRNSLIGPAEVERHLRAAHAIALEESRGIALDYFGSDYRTAPSRMPAAECEATYDRRTVAAAFRTAEIGIDPEALCRLVRVRLASDPGIRCRLRAHVRGVSPNGAEVRVDFDAAGTRESERYDHVVNALWDGRLAIDASAGLEPARPWLYRVKHYVRVHAPESALRVPSTTIVLGPFGDIAAYAGGAHYLSWYPAGMRGASLSPSPPAWPLVLDELASQEMRRSILAGLSRVVPGLAGLNGSLSDARVLAGIIFAWGKTDLHDPASNLHERHAIGPVAYGRYHTIDTGKLTMAPLFGKMVADRILERA